MELLLGMLAKGGLSTIFGGLFSWLEIREKKKHERMLLQMQYEDKKAEREHQMAYAKAEAESAERRLVIETEGEIEVAEIGALTKALEADKASYSTGIKIRLKGWFGNTVSALGALMMFLVDFYRGVIRPSVTLYGWGFVTYMWIKVAGILDVLTADQAYQLALLILNAVLFMTARATGYWFGDRGKIPTVADLRRL